MNSSINLSNSEIETLFAAVRHYAYQTDKIDFYSEDDIEACNIHSILKKVKVIQPNFRLPWEDY